jgi:hypothetical protein
MDKCPHCGTPFRKVGGQYLCLNNHVFQAYFEEGNAATDSIGHYIRRINKSKGKQEGLVEESLYDTQKPRITRRQKRQDIIGHWQTYLVEYLQQILWLQCHSLCKVLEMDIKGHNGGELSRIVMEHWLLYVEYCCEASSSTGKKKRANIESEAEVSCDDRDEAEHDILDIDSLVSTLINITESEPKAYTNTKESDMINTDLYQAQAEKVIAWKGNVKGSFSEVSLLSMPILLTILLLGCHCMKLPITSVDIYEWILQGRLPYLSAYKRVPHYRSDLLHIEKFFGISSYIRPKSVPFPEKISRIYRHTTMIFQNDINVSLQPINAPLMLWKFSNALCLPAPIYSIASSFMDFVTSEPAFRTDHNTDSLECSIWKYSSVNSNQDPIYNLMALLVIAIKMIYEFNPQCNDSNRHIGTLESFLPKFTDLERLWQTRDQERLKHNPWAETNLYSFSDTQWRTYIEFCSKELVPSFLTSRSSNFIQNIFSSVIDPFLNLDNSQKTTDHVECIAYDKMKIKNEHLRVYPGEYSNISNTNRTNSSVPVRKYVSWKTSWKEDEPVPPDYYILIDAASRIVGSSWNTLHRIVLKLERIIRKTWGTFLPKMIQDDTYDRQE